MNSLVEFYLFIYLFYFIFFVNFEFRRPKVKFSWKLVSELVIFILHLRTHNTVEI